MKSRTPFILALIGLILGMLGSLMKIGQYFLFKSLYSGLFGNVSDMFGINFSALMTWNLVSGIIGLVLGAVHIFYVSKLSKNPVKKDYIIVTVIGGLGIFLGLGLGGVLVLIGGIIGISKSNKK